MKTKFFGFFDKDSQPGLIEGNPKIDKSNLFQIAQEYAYNSGKRSCFAWGQFYDLNKTCHDLKIEITKNPAEALIKAFADNNFQKVESFYGEFTYLFIDENTVVIGRDLVGAGLPVYYTEKYFSNTIDSFKQIKNFDFALDYSGVKTFLNIGTPLPPKTLVKDVNQLLPGEYLVYSNKKLSKHLIYSFDKYTKNFGSLKISEQEATEELESLHKAAIGRRIKGKSKVALLLSGGYDSGGNIAALRDIYDGSANGYSIGFKDDQWSELPLAKLLADTFDVKFKSYLIDGSEIDELPVILKELGTPFQENGLMVNYTVMKMVSNHSNELILGGDGNDQVYGTGMHHAALHYLSSKYGIKHIQKLLSFMLSGTNHSKLSKVDFHNAKILNVDNQSSFGFNEKELGKLLKQKTEKLNTNFLKINELKVKSFEDLFKSHTYYKDFVHDGCNLIIFKASNMARLYNQKLSYPYMDKDCIDFVFSLPREMRIPGTVNEIAKGHSPSKYLHKKYLKPKLPREITERKKQGGFAPLPMFFNDGERRKLIYQIIRNSNLSKEIYKSDHLEIFFNQYENICTNRDAWFWHQQSMAFKLFNLLTLTIWWDIHFNENKGMKLEDFI